VSKKLLMVKIAIQSHIAIEKIARERRLHEQKERVQNPIISCLARTVWQKIYQFLESFCLPLPWLWSLKARHVVAKQVSSFPNVPFSIWQKKNEEFSPLQGMRLM